MEHSNPKGLKKSAVIDQLVASQGNAFIRMDGVDDNGDILTGDNSHFNLRVPVERNEIEQSPARAGQHLRDKFNELVDKGIVQVGAQPRIDEGPGSTTTPKNAEATPEKLLAEKSLFTIWRMSHRSAPPIENIWIPVVAGLVVEWGAGALPYSSITSQIRGVADTGIAFAITILGFVQWGSRYSRRFQGWRCFWRWWHTEAKSGLTYLKHDSSRLSASLPSTLPSLFSVSRSNSCAFQTGRQQHS